MSGILRSLIWKEWHELKWKAAALVAVAVGAPLVVMSQGGTVDRAHDLVGVLTILTYWFLPLGAAFVAMSVGASEGSRGALALLRSLPVEPWKIMSVKLTMGAMAALAPILTLYVLDVCLLDPDVPGDPASRWLPASSVAVSVYLWTVAVAIGRRSEWHAGVAGVVLFLLWGVYAAVADSFGTRSVAFTVLYASPLGFYAVSLSGATTLLALQTPVFAGLVAWSLWRFGRMPAGRPKVPGTEGAGVTRDSALAGPARRSRLAALAWLEWRQLRPLCLIAVLSIPAFSSLHVYSAYSDRSIEELLGSWMLIKSLQGLGGYTHFLGVFVAVLAAAAAFAGDLQPKIAAFWRSRPIAPSEWFLVKYLIGVSIVVATLSVPIVICSVALALAPTLGDFRSVLLVLVGPPLHVLTFTVATCLICVSRQSFYSGLLAAMVAYAVIFVPTQYDALRWMRFNEMIGRIADPSRFDVAGYVAYAATLLALTVPVLFVSYAVIRKRLG